MRYFRKSPTEVYAYDETQSGLADLALQNGWEEITGAWPPLPPEPTLPEQFEMVRQALQGEIDRRARVLGFSSGDALMLYAGKDNPFRPVADPFFQWEAAVWFEAGAYRQQVIEGLQSMITPQEAVDMMPLLEL